VEASEKEIKSKLDLSSLSNSVFLHAKRELGGAQGWHAAQSWAQRSRPAGELF